MRPWRTFVRYISQCLYSPHSLQRLAVCYLVLGWLLKRAWVMFQRRLLYNLCNYFRTHSLATVHVGIICSQYSLLDFLSIEPKCMFVITVRQLSQTACAFIVKGPEEACGMWNHHLRNTTVYWKRRFPAVVDVIVWFDSTQRRLGLGNCLVP